jgi:hypothetical protein
VNRGALRLPLAPGVTASAPGAGVHLGIGQAGPVALRLFRQVPTRIAVVGPVQAAQLLAIRAAAGGTAVLVLTVREHLWSAAIAHGPSSRVSPPGPNALQLAGTPGVIVDDRPEAARGLGEAGEFQCRIELRAPTTQQDLAALAQADAVLLGRVDAELAAAVPGVFAVAPAHPAHLTSLADGVVAVLRRGALDYVTLDPTAAEASLLRAA